MKKKHLFMIPDLHKLRESQIGLKMRVTFIVFLICISQTFAFTGYTQNKRLSIKLENVPIKSVLAIIEDNSEFFFMYESNNVDVEKRVNVMVENKTVPEILNDIFANTDIIYKINNRQIALTTESLATVGQQILKVTGKVTDSFKASLPGVSVVIKGTTIGTITDANGNYSLANVPANATLQFSFVGMKLQEIAVGNKTLINIILTETMIGLDEVVAVGYGRQSKAKISGAISNIENETLTKRPTNDVSNLLQGRIPGLSIKQGTGQPGANTTNIEIRGIGTFSGAGTTPLVIIDGISGSLSDVNPENIESVSVLKDAASCAIYGARAANGVIVVTTKQGTAGKMEITYHGDFQIQSATMQPDLITNSVEYMQMWNAAGTRQGIPNNFDQSIIDAYKNAKANDPKYPNFNWIKACIRPVAVNKQSISVTGGNEKTHYYANMSYYSQPGVVIGHDYKQYSGQVNFDTKINNYLTFGTNISVNTGQFRQPYFNNSNYMLMIYGSQPMFSPYLADGSGKYTHGAWPDKWVNRNPVMVANEGGDFTDREIYKLSSFLKVDILPELTWLIKGAIDYEYSFRKVVQYPVDSYSFASGDLYSDGWPSRNGVSNKYSKNKFPTFYSTLDYKKTFAEKHNLSALAGYNQEYFVSRYLSGYRKDFNFPELSEINAGGTDGQQASGLAYEWAIQSFFGRLGYDYLGKYIFEANIRRDGTSRIVPENRWGVFPSFSAAWMLSKEEFVKNLSWVDNLKLRTSWGKLGNQNIGNYPYQDILSPVAYPLGTSLSQGLVQTGLTDKTLKWETTSITDIGLDLSLKKGIFSLTFDWYNKSTTGILSQAQIPESIGLSAPTINYASMDNKGIELGLGHRNTIGEFKYSIDVNYYCNRNEITKLQAPSFDLNSYVIGKPIGQYYMVQWDGIFQSQAEIDAAPVHPYSPKPGDLRFKDANGDGKIDEQDRVFVDGAQPKFTYGANINLKWRNWDLSLFFQGVKGQKYYATNWLVFPFMQGTAPTTDWRNAWTPENHSQTMPAIWSYSVYNYGPNAGTDNTYYLNDASYLRLKNLNIGYNLQKEVCKKIKLNDLRVYFSADNILTFTSYKIGDPERQDTQWSGGVYPQVKTVSLGVIVKL